MVKKSNKHLFFFIVVISIIIIDQITKFLIRSNLSIGEYITLINKFFFIRHITNTGAGFSILENSNSLLIWISLIIIGIILFNYDKIIKDRWYIVSFSLIIGGAIGNLIDRILIGHVTDFISFYIIFDYFPAFNLADTAISIGAIILLISLFKKK
ncbi:MAG: signal peptidase II [Candidatus Woesearchaeota archaeon]